MKEISNEKLIIERVKSGDKESYSRLIEFYTPSIYNLCYRMLNNNSDADDAASVTFFHGYKHINNFRGDCCFSTWLYRIAVNTCNTMLKKRKKERGILLSNIQNDACDEDTDIFDTMESSDDVEVSVIMRGELSLVSEALQSLPQKYLAIIVLYYIESYSYQEIADITKTNIGTVKSRISRGKEIILKIIEKSGNKSELLKSK